MMLIIISLICFLIRMVHLEESDQTKHIIVSTTKNPNLYNDEEVSFDGQVELRTSLSEMKYRLERFELKFLKLQNSLEKVLKLHGVEVFNLDPLTTNGSSDLTKIGQIVEEKLKLYQINSCNNVTQDEKLNQRLEEIKNEIIKQIDQRQSELLAEVKKSIGAQQSRHIDEIKQVIVAESLNKKINGNSSLPRVEEEVPSEKYPQDCKEILNQGKKISGIYTIKPNSSPQPFKVLCDMELRGGGWTYFMRRFDGSQEFFLNWTDYKQGFGNLNAEFWLGLDHLHHLTGSRNQELLFKLTDWEGKTVYAHFKKFTVGNETEQYAIKVLAEYSGDAGTSFINHISRKFSTPDRLDEANCAETYHGPWWYGPGCFHVKLTGRYLKGNMQSYADGIHYYEFHGYKYSLKEVNMLIRS